jgi:hypothetical protein
MTNPIEPVRRPVVQRLLPIAATRPGRALARGVAAVAGWARLTNGALRLGGADVAASFDSQTRALLWHALTETISTIAALAGPDVAPEAGLAALETSADRVREQVAMHAPGAAMVFEGSEPPQIFVLEILTQDVQPCLARWLPRLEAWCQSGRRTADWALLPLCRNDLARTRERLVERGWQLGVALGLPGLDRLLPQRLAAVAALIAPDELAAAEAEATMAPDPMARQAGWRIYVEAAARLPAQEMRSAPGAIGEAIAAIETLAGEIRTALKAMPPPQPRGAANTIQALGFELLTKGIQPFLSEWRPRYRRFSASERPEAKWRRADECRAALAASRARCLPTIGAIGRQIGAPPLPDFADPEAIAEEDAPLQLPPPATRS